MPATSTRYGLLGPRAFLKGFSVYGYRDSGIGKPIKKTWKYVKLRGFIPVKGDDDAFD